MTDQKPSRALRASVEDLKRDMGLLPPKTTRKKYQRHKMPPKQREQHRKCMQRYRRKKGVLTSAKRGKALKGKHPVQASEGRDNSLYNTPENQLKVLAMELGIDERTIDQHLKRVAEEKLITLDSGEKISRGEALARAAIARATREATTDQAKSPNWTRFVLERLGGKAVNRIEGTIEGPMLGEDERERIRVLAQRLALDFDKPEIVADADSEGNTNVRDPE